MGNLDKLFAKHEHQLFLSSAQRVSQYSRIRNTSFYIPIILWNTLTALDQTISYYELHAKTRYQYHSTIVNFLCLLALCSRYVIIILIWISDCPNEKRICCQYSILLTHNHFFLKQVSLQLDSINLGYIIVLRIFYHRHLLFVFLILNNLGCIRWPDSVLQCIFLISKI